MAASICAVESVLWEGISRGPAGRKELGLVEDLDGSGAKSVGEGILKGGPLRADVEERVESVRDSPVWPLIGKPELLSLTNRSSNSRFAGLEIVTCSCVMAWPCSASGFGGRTGGFGRGAAGLLTGVERPEEYVATLADVEEEEE